MFGGVYYVSGTVLVASFDIDTLNPYHHPVGESSPTSKLRKLQHREAR